MTYKEYLYRKAARQRIPLGGTFELSPVCNFSCHMCYVRKTRAELKRLGKQEITADQWIRMGKECRDAGMLYLLLTGCKWSCSYHTAELALCHLMIWNHEFLLSTKKYRSV